MDPGEYSGAMDPNGVREGQGICKWADGSHYNGEWKGGYRHGKGVFKSREGTHHDGMWQNDIRHGPGDMLYTKSGNRIKGTWENDRLNGEATIINSGKDPKPCVFKMDLAIGQDDQGGCSTFAYVGMSILLMLGIYAMAALIVIIGGGDEEKQQNFLIICIVLYIIYVVMSCCTDTQKFANTCTNYLDTLTNIDRAIAARPIVTFRIECWHMETEHYKDSEGNSQTREKKVVTHRAS